MCVHGMRGLRTFWVSIIFTTVYHGARGAFSLFFFFLCTLINGNTTVFSETFFRSPALDVSLSANCVYDCIVA